MAIYVTAVDGMTSYDAADATAIQTDLVSQEGVVGTTGTDLEVHAQGTPDMTVKVKKGSCFVLRDAYVASDNTIKFWHVVVTADANVSISSNSSGSTRIDRICVKVDTSVTPDATASNYASLVSVEGTPGGGVPSVPANHLSLAQVTVVNGETAINTGDITDERTFIGLVLPYAHGYRLKDTGANLDAQIYETSAGVVHVKGGKSGGGMEINQAGEQILLKPRANLTVTVPSSTDTLVGRDTTDTLTNKRVTPRVGTVASSATPSINTDNVDLFSITAQAAAITSMTTNLSGTPTNGQKLIIRIKDDGTGRAITWGASFASRGATLPTTTTANKVTYVGLLWNSVASTWDCVAAVTET